MEKVPQPDYLEIGGLFRIVEQLEQLDSHQRNFKLSNAISYSLFVLNIIKYRYLEKNPATLRSKLDSRLDQILIASWFYDFYFLQKDGRTRRTEQPTHYQLLNWVRNRVVHYRKDESDGVAPPWPRGLTVIGRGPDGIRSFSINGHIGRDDSSVIIAKSDRRRLTSFVKYTADVYERCLVESGVIRSRNEALEKAELGEAQT